MTTEIKGLITAAYKDIFDKAQELAKLDLVLYPLRKHEDKRERFEKHLIGMMELYSIRYGDPDQRLRLVNYIEQHLFQDGVTITYDVWDKIQRAILCGEYNPINLEKKG